jgi:Protein kinase domain
MGTPNYMSPEQVTGKNVTQQADLFSTGIVIYHMLTGRRPFQGTDLVAILYAVVHEQPPALHESNPDLPEWCGSFVAKLLAKSPAERFGSAGEALRELRRLRGAPAEAQATRTSLLRVSIASPDETPTSRFLFADTQPDGLWKRRVRPRIVVSTLAPIALAAVLFGAWALWELSTPLPVAIPPAKMSELQAKKTALAEAAALYDRAEWRASVAKYEEYLSRYPSSPAAVEGRDRAMAKLLGSKSPPQIESVPADARRHGSKPVRGKDDQQLSFLERIRRFFHRDR